MGRKSRFYDTLASDSLGFSTFLLDERKLTRL